MSAVSNLDGTGPLDAAHRTDAPVWAFHLTLAYVAWGAAHLVWRLFNVKQLADTWEARSYDRHPALFISGLIAAGALILSAIVAAAVFA